MRYAGLRRCVQAYPSSFQRLQAHSNASKRLRMPPSTSKRLRAASTAPALPSGASAALDHGSTGTASVQGLRRKAWASMGRYMREPVHVRAGSCEGWFLRVPAQSGIQATGMKRAKPWLGGLPGADPRPAKASFPDPSPKP